MPLTVLSLSEQERIHRREGLHGQEMQQRTKPRMNRLGAKNIKRRHVTCSFHKWEFHFLAVKRNLFVVVVFPFKS